MQNIYAAKSGGLSIGANNARQFLDYLLKEGVISPELRRTFLSGGDIKVYLDDLTVAVYKLTQSKYRHGMEKDFDLTSGEIDYLLYYFDESMLDSSSRAKGSNGSFDAASLLTRFSTIDPAQGEKRADAVDQLIAQHRTGNPDGSRVLDLLQNHRA